MEKDTPWGLGCFFRHCLWYYWLIVSLCLQTISHWVHAKKDSWYAELLSLEIGGTKDGWTEGTNQVFFAISK